MKFPLSQALVFNNKAKQNTPPLFLIPWWKENGLRSWKASVRVLLPLSSFVTLKKFLGFLCLSFLNH